MRIDNNHTQYVIAYLGDLGRDLPASERLHWKNYNIPPDGTGSDVTFQRDFLAQFADPKKADLRFKYLYASLGKEWTERLGWSLFLPLSTGDEHYLKTLRVPLTESLSEFDQQILALAKVLVDSLNEKELEKRLTTVPTGAKGISKFELFLEQNNFAEPKDHTRILRVIQQIRSTGVAHLKGKDYLKIAGSLGLDQKKYGSVFADLLDEASSLLTDLQTHFLPPVT